MAPFKRLPKSVSDAKKSGLAPLTDFFSKKVKRGRKPKKNASKAGRPVLVKAPIEFVQRTVASTKEPKLKRKKTRQNWSKGDGLKCMTEAVSEWEDELKKPEAKRMSMTFFADRYGIPLPTFSKHVTTADEKQVSVEAGKKIYHEQNQSRALNGRSRPTRSGESRITHPRDLSTQLHQRTTPGILPTHSGAKSQEDLGRSRVVIV